MKTTRYSRQELLFGREGQKKINETSVGIVGLGGTGSHVVQGLAYLGVKDFLLIDGDRIEETNLNRLIGGCETDIEKQTPKVEIAERLIRCIQPGAEITKIFDYLRSAEALKTLITRPYIFGCVDNEGARLILMEVAVAYDISFIDLATEIIPVENGLPRYGGRVVISRPGDYCLNCAAQIDMEEAKQELETKEVKELRKKHGYGIEEKDAASVVSLNGVIANLAVTEFLTMVTGLREPNRLLTYYGEREEKNIVNSRNYESKKDCYYCNYLVGKREDANIFRYVK